MFCSCCGTRLDDSATRCTSCGLDFAPTTPVRAIMDAEVTDEALVREALGDEYEILEELGRGGMAIVYRAREIHLEREVAIKVLPFSFAFDTEFVTRFEREARTAAGLEHPNIIPIYRVGKSGRVTYFIMKYLRGQSLTHVLADRARISPPEIRRILVEAGSALGYAASRGIVHRDVKPDNIMFDEHGVCMLTDFGIAKAATSRRLTGTGMSIGTPHYMSPEQARAQATDGRSDIYSLGVVAYQCLTGRVPYDGDDSFSIGYKHIMEPLPEPALETPDERRLFEIIRRMLAKDPAERFQKAEELLAALEGQGAAGIRPSVSAPPPPPAAPPSRASTAPTTPLPRVSRVVSSGTRGSQGVRPVARRAEPGANLGVWILLFLVAGAAGGGAWYFLKLRPAQNAAAVSPPPADSLSDSVAGPGGTAADSQLIRDSIVLAQAESTALAGGDTTAAAPAATPLAPVPASTPGTRDSGAVRLKGLPSGSAVLIDERRTTTPVTWLPVGSHVIAVSAPRYQFYTDTVEIRSGQILDVQPILTPLGGASPTPRQRRQLLQQQRAAAAQCETPGPTYNADRSCYDVRPRPVKPPFVPLTPEVDGTPRLSVLWVNVSPEGQTLDVRRHTPSNDPVFERLAESYARTMAWHPATKDGKPVAGWTQMAFPPQP
ncbi:MAG: protein kinase [Gemmatimonadales bacterium]